MYLKNDLFRLPKLRLEINSSLLRVFLFLVAFCVSTLSYAQVTYYVANSGNDNNSGTSMDDPWKTINKVNVMMPQLNPGDAILFNKGDEFREELLVTTSGNTAQPITFGSYGNGEKPIINGAVPVTGWTDVGTNLWEANYTGSLNHLNNLFINNQLQQVGRYPNVDAPNGGYLTIDASADRTKLTDAALQGTGDWTGATAVVKVRMFLLNRPVVVSQTGNTLNLNTGGIGNYDMGVGYGYFLQNHPATLDRNGEWYYNQVTKKILLYSETNPNSLVIEAPERNNSVYFTGQSNIIIENISLAKSNDYGIRSESSGNIEVKNCIFQNLHNAILLNAVATANVSGNTVKNTSNNAIYIAGTNYICSNNEILNTALLAGMGMPNNNQYNAMNIVGTDADVFNNRIQDVGYAGIRFEGKRIKIRNNKISGFAKVKSDVGGIYSFKGFAPASYGYGENMVSNNIISDAFPNMFGTLSGPVNPNYAVGIYMDNNSHENTVINNTVYNIQGSGLLLNHTSKQHLIRDNTFYNNLYGYSLFTEISDSKDYIIKNNIIFSGAANQQTGHIQSKSSDMMKTFGQIDSNYYGQPFEVDSTIIQTNETDYNPRISRNHTLAKWKAFGYDTHAFSSAYKAQPYTFIADVNNRIANTRFTYAATSWTFTPANSYKPVWDNNNVLDGGSVRFNLNGSTSKSTSRASTVLGSLEAGKFYELRMTIKGSTDTASLHVTLSNAYPAAKFKSIRTNINRRDVILPFSVFHSSDNVNLHLSLHDNNNEVWIDNIYFYEIEATVTPGNDHIVFETNESAVPKNVVLGTGNYQDVKGNSYSGSVTIAPYSSVLLLKQPEVLPIDIIKFEGSSKGCQVDLIWETAMEENVERFEIQKSVNSGSFKTMAMRPAKSNINKQDNPYSYSISTAQEESIAYYRLKVMDKDGTEKLSSVLDVRTLCNNTGPIVFPNPAQDELYLTLKAKDQNRIQLSIIDLQGETVKAVNYNIQSGENLLKIEIRTLKPGYYILRFLEGGKEHHLNFLKS
jgi:hypothetical protein